MSSYGGSYFLAVLTLLCQLDPKENSYELFRVILRDRLLPVNLSPDPFDRTKANNIEFSQIVSKFLTDRGRARSLWVSPQKYADLARYLMEFLHDK